MPSFELRRQDFKATGLEYEKAFNALFAGDFRSIPFDRDAIQMSAMMKGYIDTFGIGCKSFLPANAVPVMKDVCTARWSRSGNCAEWKSVPAGHSADPHVYSAYQGLQRLAATKAFSEAFAILQGGLSGMADKVQVIRSMNSDIAELVRMNGCPSRGLNRFQENMALFAENKQPIVISGGGAAVGPSDGNAPPPPPAANAAVAPSPDQNFTQMLDDFVDANSRGWAMNRYARGSMSQVRVASRDQEGRPRRITGTYVYQGFSGRATGTVALEFSDGVPQCLFFWDFPSACRPPDRSVTSAYQSGKYATR